MITFDDFTKVDIRVGTVVKAEPFDKAKKPAYKLWVDFGETIGTKQSSAQITGLYTIEELIGKQVLSVVNLSPMRVAGFKSEVLILGTYSDQGVVLIQPEQNVKNGDKLG